MPCWNCQRNMMRIKTGSGNYNHWGHNEPVPDTFHCRYCGFINYKLLTEATAFISSGYDKDGNTSSKNVPVMYWYEVHIPQE